MSVYRKAAVQGQSRTLPGHYYTSTATFQDEQERIFARRWCCVGRSEQIARPGDFALVSPAGESLILTRGRDGVARALYNVCRHRGTQLCTQERGRFRETIQCPYHAWTYGLDGRLLSARQMHEVAGFDRAEHPLQQAALVEWEGFLYVWLAGAPLPFDKAFAPLLGKFAGWRLPELRCGQQITYNVQANWKLIVQNYSECYHCPLIHPQLDRLSPSDSGRNDLDEGPFLGGFSTLRHSGGSLTTSGSAARPPIAGLRAEDIDRIYYYALFPNLLISLHPDYVMAHILWPEAPDRTRIACLWLFEPSVLEQPDFDPRDAVDFWDTTNRQDWHVCELTQRGVSSRAYLPGPYAQAEGLLAAFDQYYLEAMHA